MMTSNVMTDFDVGLKRLKGMLGDAVLTGHDELIPYKRDASYFEGELPAAVVIPQSAEQISEIMKICSEYDIPITPRGGGTSLTGSSVPAERSIVLSLKKMNKIIEVNTGDRYVVVEPGITIDELNSYLSKLNYMYPPDPGSSIAATVGGSIMTNAGGLRGAMYGATKEWVLGLEVVLSNGEIIKTGGTVLKRSEGYDLTALFIGSEGTLGIVTRAILKITPKPEKVGRIMAYFRDIDKATTNIGIIKSLGITPYMAEFMDRVALEALSKSGDFSFPEDANYLLMLDVASTSESVSREIETVAKILKENGGFSMEITTDEEIMKKMYKLRKGLYAAELNERENEGEYIIIGDIIVPPSKLPQSLIEIKKEIENSGFKASLFGHIGDGNIHINILYNRKNNEQERKVFATLSKVGQIAIKNGGSISAEHGIGLEKKNLLIEELTYRNSLYNIELMKGIKKLFDPKGIMNRGKVF